MYVAIHAEGGIQSNWNRKQLEYEAVFIHNYEMVSVKSQGLIFFEDLTERNMITTGEIPLLAYDGYTLTHTEIEGLIRCWQHQ